MRPVRTLSLAVAIVGTTTAIAQVTIADAGPDQYLCSSNAFLQGNAVASGEVGTWSLVSGNLNVVDLQDPGSQVVNAFPGVNVLRWTITDGVEFSSDDVAIWVYDGNAPQANAGVDVVVELPETSVLLQAGPFSWPTTCAWTVIMGTGVIGDPSEAVTMYYGANVGLNVLQWTCDNGPCGISTDEVVITVEEALALGWIPDMTGHRTMFDPATGRLTITAPSSVERVIIIDQMGRVVRDRSVNERSASLDVSDLSSGSYAVRVLIGDQVIVDRFMVVR